MTLWTLLVRSVVGGRNQNPFWNEDKATNFGIPVTLAVILLTWYYYYYYHYSTTATRNISAPQHSNDSSLEDEESFTPRTFLIELNSNFSSSLQQLKQQQQQQQQASCHPANGGIVLKIRGSTSETATTRFKANSWKNYKHKKHNHDVDYLLSYLEYNPCIVELRIFNVYDTHILHTLLMAVSKRQQQQLLVLSLSNVRFDSQNKTTIPILLRNKNSPIKKLCLQMIRPRQQQEEEELEDMFTLDSVSSSSLSLPIQDLELENISESIATDIFNTLSSMRHSFQRLSIGTIPIQSSRNEQQQQQQTTTTPLEEAFALFWKTCPVEQLVLRSYRITPPLLKLLLSQKQQHHLQKLTLFWCNFVNPEAIQLFQSFMTNNNNNNNNPNPIQSLEIGGGSGLWGVRQQFPDQCQYLADIIQSPHSTLHELILSSGFSSNSFQPLFQILTTHEYHKLVHLNIGCIVDFERMNEVLQCIPKLRKLVKLSFQLNMNLDNNQEFEYYESIFALFAKAMKQNSCLQELNVQSSRITTTSTSSKRRTIPHAHAAVAPSSSTTSGAELLSNMMRGESVPTEKSTNITKIRQYCDRNKAMHQWTVGPLLFSSTSALVMTSIPPRSYWPVVMASISNNYYHRSDAQSQIFHTLVALHDEIFSGEQN